MKEWNLAIFKTIFMACDISDFNGKTIKINGDMSSMCDVNIWFTYDLLSQMPPLGNEHGVLRARFLFNSREQQSSESLEDFLKSLKELSKRCKYEASQNLVQDLLRDRLISGLRNKEIQARLLNCPDDLALVRSICVCKYKFSFFKCFSRFRTEL